MKIYFTEYIDDLVNAVSHHRNLLTIYRESGHHIHFLSVIVFMQVENQIGRCKPIAILYRGFHHATCVDILDGVVNIGIKTLVGGHKDDYFFCRMEYGSVCLCV